MKLFDESFSLKREQLLPGSEVIPDNALLPAESAVCIIIYYLSGDSNFTVL